ncbi:MAG TPA: DUF1501 domain-containing protein [Phototrophicaceae bacterium]|jgi:uncharacterized protein (DUF1501 family)|nr:DUF1501 domain-containing protein [Phototrophicaceae bacterium]
MNISRRNLLQSIGVVGVSGTLFPRWMPKLVFSPVAQPVGKQRDVLVAIFQRGGMDGLNVVVPFGEGSNYYDRRPTIAISEPDGSDSSAIDLDGFFGLHPALRPLKTVFDAGMLGVIHAAGSPDPSRSHFDAMEYMERGIPGDKTTANGWITRHLKSAAWQNDSPFRAIGMGAMIQSSLRGDASAMALRSIADFHLSGRQDQLASIQRTISGLYNVQAPADLLGTQAAGVFNTIDTLTAMAAQNYTPAGGAEYPDSEFGLGLRQIAQLIKADVGLEVAAIDIDGWDTHEEEGSSDGQLAGLLNDFGRGLAAFYADMQDYMANITVVSMSEFGRRATENASGGTDHGHGNCMFVMGGGVKGGVYARWNGLADGALDEGDLAVTTDYRDVLAEVLTKRISNPAVDQVFPGYTPNSLDIFKSRET